MCLLLDVWPPGPRPRGAPTSRGNKNNTNNDTNNKTNNNNNANNNSTRISTNNKTSNHNDSCWAPGTSSARRPNPVEGSEVVARRARAALEPDWARELIVK